MAWKEFEIQKVIEKYKKGYCLWYILAPGNRKRIPNTDAHTKDEFRFLLRKLSYDFYRLEEHYEEDMWWYQLQLASMCY